MANIVTQNTLLDTNNRALIEFIISTDGTAMANTTILDVGALKFALNANSQILGSGTDRLSQYKITIRQLMGQGSFPSGGYSQLLWGGNNANVSIVTLGMGAFDYNYKTGITAGTIPFTSNANATGNLAMTLVRTANGDALSFIIEIEKHSSGFDRGKFSDPDAFNVTNKTTFSTKIS